MPYQASFSDPTGARYVVLSACPFRTSGLPGAERLEHVPHVELRGVVDRLARREPALFARLLARVTGELGGARGVGAHAVGDGPSMEARVRRLVHAFGQERPEAPGTAPRGASLYLLRPRRADALHAHHIESEENRRLDAALAKLGDRALEWRGDSYRLARAGAPRPALRRDAYEALSEAQLFALLQELTADARTVEPQKSALTELIAVAEAQRRTQRTTALVLLRRLRHYARLEEEAGPPATPSQIRAQAKKDIALYLVDEWGNPMGELSYKLETPADGTLSGVFPASGEKKHTSLDPGTASVTLKEHPDDWLKREGRPVGWLVKGLSLRLTDAAGCPLAERAFKATFKDGTVLDGSTDARGQARLEDTPSYPVTLAFEDFDAEDYDS